MKDACTAVLAELDRTGNLRSIPGGQGDGDGLVDLSSNDYLGLASRTDLQSDFYSRPGVTGIPLTSSASRLLASRQDEYASLEHYLGQLYGRRVLLFNSGYHANTGTVSALAALPGAYIVADRLVHASIIDGITLGRAPFTRFRHNDLGHLEHILEAEYPRHRHILVIAESVYSMDGDTAPLDGLLELKRRYPRITLYIDEAHAVGALGSRGLGLCRQCDGYEGIDVVIGTLGKACASMGAFAAVGGEVYSYLVNRSRSLIFSTALPPLQAAWTEYLMRRIVTMDAERAHLASLSRHLAEILTPLSAAGTVHPSHIQPLVVGDPRRAVALSAALRREGFKVLPIRRPTVPPGTDRLRISLSAALGAADIDRFGQALNSIM